MLYQGKNDECNASGREVVTMEIYTMTKRPSMPA